MGLLVDGVWHDQWYDTGKSGGKFVRSEAQFRNWVTKDGAPGPAGPNGPSKDGFKAESGRYHLYVCFACPWAHRTLIFRALKRLDNHISISATHWHMAQHGWTFAPGDGVIADPLMNAQYLHQIYTASDPKYSGRVTVPVLWDKQQRTIVSNESPEIIRMFNSAFDALPGVDAALDFYPAPLRAEIDAINERVYRTVNNGVYRSGFATGQAPYDEAVRELFDSLDWLEGLLAARRYLAGDQRTEADWRLFTTLLRFDPVYHTHFKCNLRRLVDYPNLWNYTRELYQVPGVAPTVRMDHIKKHYWGSHRSINPSGLVPIGPAIDYATAHDRDRFRAAA
ncbi:MAG: glutathione S-transferase family protein [Alphaproteobacteria bacterium]